MNPLSLDPKIKLSASHSGVPEAITSAYLKRTLGATLLILICLFCTGAGARASVTLGWDAATDSAVAGYRLYQGIASHVYTTNFGVGKVTQRTVYGLSNGVTYYWAATAYNSNGLESTFSTEISFTPSAVTSTPPAIVLTSPTNSATCTAPGTILLAAGVTTNGHAINKVQFYSEASLLGEDSTPPYGLTWTNVSAGTYGVSARVVYDATNWIASATAAVMVSPAALQLLLAVLPGQVVQLSGTGTIGHVYDVLATQDFKSWAVLTNVTMDSKGCFTITDAGAASRAARYYRLRGTGP